MTTIPETAERTTTMQLTVERDTLADAAGWIARNLPARPSVPVMAGARLTHTGTTLEIAGYDYETSTVATAATSIGGRDGTALVSARLLAEITKALPRKPVTVTAAGAHLELVCGSARFTLPTMPVEDYPTLPEMPAAVGTIDAAAFASAVGQVAIAAGRDETLPAMTGVRIELNGSTIAMLATDRYRLAVRELEWRPDNPEVSLNALVPARTLNDAAKTLGPAGGTINIGLTGDGEGVIGLAGNDRQVTSRLLDGATYPPVRSLFPATHNAQARVTVGPLIEVVKRVALVADRTTPVLLRFNTDGLVVEAGGTNDAQASEATDADFTGEALTVGFNPQYLIDGLHALNTTHARLEFVDPFKPAVISPATADGDTMPGYRYLIVPVRVTR